MRRATALILVLAACDFEPRPVKTAEGHSRIWPPGSGKVVSFAIEADPGAALSISSRDIHAQARKEKLVVNFNGVAFELGQKQLDPVELSDFKVRILKDDAKTVVAESAARDLDGHHLTLEKPRQVTREFEITLPDALTACESSCVVAITANYFPAEAKSDFIGRRKRTGAMNAAASLPVSLQLGLGKAARWTPPPPPVETASAQSEKPVITNACSFLTEGEARQLTGKAMKSRGYGTATRCVLEAPGGTGITFNVSIDEPIVDRATKGADAVESLFLGDRAGWMPKTSQLFVEEGQLGFVVTTGGPDAQREAQAIAERLLINAGVLRNAGKR